MEFLLKVSNLFESSWRMVQENKIPPGKIKSIQI